MQLFSGFVLSNIVHCLASYYHIQAICNFILLVFQVYNESNFGYLQAAIGLGIPLLTMKWITDSYEKSKSQ